MMGERWVKPGESTVSNDQGREPAMPKGRGAYTVSKESLVSVLGYGWVKRNRDQKARHPCARSILNFKVRKS